MVEIKTRVSDDSVEDFINSVENEGKRKDGFALLELFKRATGEPAKMWGKSLIGFGQYHYKSEKSSQEGDWMLTAFSVRKANLTIYIMPGATKYPDLLAKLGKHKASKGSCIYINKLSDVDMNVLEELVKIGYENMKAAHAGNTNMWHEQ